jgi:hypothetical protein
MEPNRENCPFVKFGYCSPDCGLRMGGECAMLIKDSIVDALSYLK